MGLIHHLAHGLVVSAFQSVAHIQHALNFSNHIFGPQKVLTADLVPNLVQPQALGVGEEVHLRMVLLDGRGRLLARFPALVVGAGSQFMLHAGIDEHQLVAHGVEGEILVFSGFAVEADEGTFLTEDGGKLVHDAALHTAVIVLRALANLSQLELLYSVAVDLIDGIGKYAFQGCRGAEAGAQRNVTGKHGIESLHLAAPLEGFPAHAKHVAGPGLFGFVLFLEAELHHFVKINGIDFYFVRSIGLDSRHDAKINGAGEHIAAIVVRMLTNQVDAPAGHIKGSFLTKKALEFFLDLCFHNGLSVVSYKDSKIIRFLCYGLNLLVFNKV